MQEAGLGREAHKHVWSIIDALITQQDLRLGNPE
jgi:hypothetical protein